MIQVLAVVTILALSLSGCGRQSPAQYDRASAAQSAGSDSSTQREGWKAGVHYEELTTPQPTDVGSGKIEVLEFFWYGCPHCYTLEPHVMLWERKKPDYVELVRVPTVWGPSGLAHARLFYALQALGREDLHQQVYDTIHRRGNGLLGDDEHETRKLQLAFADAHGITAEEFTNAYNSPTVNASLERAGGFARRYRVDALPTLVVNGAYKVDLKGAGGCGDNLIGIVDYLAASGRRR